MAYSKANIKQHLESPLIRCECGKCDEWIHSVNKNGIKIKYKQGHNSHLIKHKSRYMSKSFNYKGGRIKRHGYYHIKIYDHPFRNKQDYYSEHRYILEQHLSKKYNMKIFILPYFEVHHKDGTKDNNIPENLEMVTKFKHRQITFTKDKSNRICDDCDSNKTYVYGKNGYSIWRVHPKTRGWCCSKCFDKNYRIRSK